MSTPNPFSRIPDPDSGYAGTVLETPQERAARSAREDGPGTCTARPCRNGDHYGQCADVTAPYFARAGLIVTAKEGD